MEPVIQSRFFPSRMNVQKSFPMLSSRIVIAKPFRFLILGSPTLIPGLGEAPLPFHSLLMG